MGVGEEKNLVKLLKEKGRTTEQARFTEREKETESWGWLWGGGVLLAIAFYDNLLPGIQFCPHN